MGQWIYPDYIRKTQRRLYVSTAGWSGHEELIQALRESRSSFWLLNWISSNRGGHHVFDMSSARHWHRELTKEARHLKAWMEDDE